jgi:hypothetical protein
MLLAAAWQRVLIALVAVAGLWGAVLWVVSATPSVSPARPRERVAAAPIALAAAELGPLRAVVSSGMAAPGGGRFDRFDVAAQPVVAPVNVHGQVAFYATVLHAPAREGIFLADAGRITKVAAFGDPVPGGGTLTGFVSHPVPALNAAGHVAFGAAIAGGRAPEGVFLVGEAGLQVIALAGDDAPGLPTGILVGFDTPALNDNDELALVATVRRGRDTLDVLYFWNGRRLQRVVTEGERLLRIGGTLGEIGVPALNNSGVIAFPAAIIKGPALGGIFVAGARELRLLVQAGDRARSGAMLVRFSERVALDEADGIVFGGYLEGEARPREAVLRGDPDGVAELAVEGEDAPAGGRYAGFGPWPTVAPDGAVAFVAALDGGPAPLAAFMGNAGDLRRIAAMGEALPAGRRIGRFALNGVAVAGPGSALTFATITEQDGEPGAIYCHCPTEAR